jgi:hypothetical protein
LADRQQIVINGRAEIKRKYDEKSIKERIEALFLDNLGKIVTREQIIQVATDPKTGHVPENWHQRLSELRTDDGYTILSYRDTKRLKGSEYLMASAEKRAGAGKRVKISQAAWKKVLHRAGDCCEWNEGGETCGLKQGEIDPVSGGTVHLTPDHKQPHQLNPNADPDNPDVWQALCGRHQVVKKNYWDNITGKLNLQAIVQAAPEKEKRAVYNFLKRYFEQD